MVFESDCVGIERLSGSVIISGLPSPPMVTHIFNQGRGYVCGIILALLVR